MNRKAKRKSAKYAAAWGIDPAYAEKQLGVPARFVLAHRKWQQKLLTRQFGSEPILITRHPRWA